MCLSELRDFEPDDQKEIEVDEGNTAVIECHLPESQPKAQVRYSVKQEWLETSKGTAFFCNITLSFPLYSPSYLRNLPECYNPAILTHRKTADKGIIWRMWKHGDAVVYFSNYLLLSRLEEKKSSSGLRLVC